MHAEILIRPIQNGKASMTELGYTKWAMKAVRKTSDCKVNTELKL